MSANAREQIGRLSQNAEELLHETWELFAQLQRTNEALMEQTGELTTKLHSLSRESFDEGAV